MFCDDTALYLSENDSEEAERLLTVNKLQTLVLIDATWMDFRRGI